MTEDREPGSLPPESPARTKEAEGAADDRLHDEAAKSVVKERRQIVWLVLGVAAFMAAAHFTPLRAWITNVQTWKVMVRDLGWPAHAGALTPRIQLWFVWSVLAFACRGTSVG